MQTRNRLIRQYLWGDTGLPLYAAMAMFILTVSCMFLTTAFFSKATFLFYTPLFAAFWMVAGAWQEKKPLPRAVALAGGWVILFGTLCWLLWELPDVEAIGRQPFPWAAFSL
ncbi:MAG: hypothetical protein DWQ04_09890 [Chloroflexi bacterium]|nr:MAG: hypothetical protein DWQ04_09890 [Chloroflexota bacterium]